EQENGTLTAVLVTDLTEQQRQAALRAAHDALHRRQERLTAELLALTRLQEANGRLAAIVESSDDAIISVDFDGIITSWNRGAARLFGYAPDDAIGRPVTMLLPPNRPDEEPRLIERVRRGQLIDHYETVRRRKNGDLVEISLTVSPIRNERGEIIGASKIAHDISERKWAEEALRRRTAQFATLLNEAPLGVYLVDDQFRIREMNPVARAAFGGIQDVIGRDLDEVLHILWPPAYADEMMALFRHTLETGEPYITPERSEKRRDRGVVEYYEWQINRIPLPDGHYGVVCYFRDISAQVRARLALAESEARFRQLADSMPQIVWSARPDGHIEYYNERWYEFTGFARGDFNQSNWEAILHADDLQRCRDALARGVREGKPYQIECRLKDRATGEYRWFMERALPVRDERGLIVKWFGTWTDIDDMKRLHEELREANRIKDDFLGTLSHELRTPLNAILGWSQLLRSGTLPVDTQQRGLESIARSAKVQVQIVDDLLDVSRIVSGKLQIEHSPVDVGRVMTAALDTMRGPATAKGIVLTVCDDSGSPIFVDGDANRLQQVFWNLLSNAVRFTPSGGRIEVDVRRNGPTVEIVVSDTGPGIRKDFLPHVFERFQQADSTAARRHGGLGLGLSIVQHIVEAHGGSVAADSPGDGQGATFVVRLPIRIGSVPSTTGRSAEDDRVNAALIGVRVLVVDDDGDARDLTRALFEPRGAKVETAGSAADALSALRQRTFDVLLCDIGMPEQDGYSLLDAVRQLPGDRGRVPAIAVTAYASLQERAAALDAGFDAHVAKPVRPDHLAAVVVDVLKRPQSRSSA
ncbi:MAG: hybrid sensor histidine kinase/response regulator, partial [Vicinamibacteraceae bacterium]